MNRTLVLVLFAAVTASAQQSPYRLTECVLDEGGRKARPAAAASYVQRGSFHQMTIGKARCDGNYVAWIGYWHPRPYTRDVGVVEILAPVEIADTFLLVTPSANVANYGDLREVFKVWFRITRTNGTTIRLDSTTVTLNSHERQMAVFSSFRMTVTGPCVSRCSTALAADMDHSNDVKLAAFKSVARPPWPEGWTSMNPMPLSPSPRGVREGGWLAFMAGSTRFYAFKGGATPDFYSYDPLADQWKTLPLVPSGMEGRLPKRGSRGATDDNGSVFAVKGNNTLGFWRYTCADSSWTPRAGVPAGNSNKKVKAGSDLVYVTKHDQDFLYLLKGYYNEFYRYNIALDSWLTLPGVPGATAKSRCTEGSWLVSDGAGVLYAHKAKLHEFWKYDVEGDTWCTRPLTGMPFQNRQMRNKKSKDGGSASWFDGSIYALKGGNTQEFWRYFADGDTWDELDTIPTCGSSMTRKKVKNGGDIAGFGAGVFYALKGNKTNELWRYCLAPDIVAPQPGGNGVTAAGQAAVDECRLTMAPNPLRTGLATLSYAVPEAGPIALTIRDVVGRVVLTRTVTASRSGVLSLDLRDLAAGVYLAKVEAAGFSARQKLVVQR